MCQRTAAELDLARAQVAVAADAERARCDLGAAAVAVAVGSNLVLPDRSMHHTELAPGIGEAPILLHAGVAAVAHAK